MVETQDGGKSWTVSEHLLPNNYCSKLVSRFKENLLLSCHGVNGDFYQSLDEGKNWQLIREHDDF